MASPGMKNDCTPARPSIHSSGIRAGNLRMRHNQESYTVLAAALALHHHMHPNVTDALRRAIANHRVGRLEDAAELCRIILKAAPGHFDALHMLGVLHLQCRQAGAAQHWLTQALQVQPSSPAANFHLGIALGATGQASAAIGAYQQAIALAPHFVEAHFGLCEAYASSNATDQALAHCTEVLRYVPSHEGALIRRGQLLELQGKTTAALAAWEAAIAAHPELVTAHVARGGLLNDLNRPAEALESLNHALAISPGDAQALCNRGVARLQLQHYLEALQDFRAALALAPNVPMLHASLGNTLRLAGHPSQALEHYQKALELDPHLALALANRAFVLQDVGRIRESLSAFERLLETDPGHPYAAGKYLYSKLQLCAWQGYDRSVDQVCLDVEEGRPAITPLPFVAVTDLPHAQFACAQIYTPGGCESIPRPARANHQPVTVLPENLAPPRGERRIRLAYVSADFRDHAMTNLMAGVFESHRADLFDTIAISLAPVQDTPMGRRVKSAFGTLIDVSAWTDDNVVQLMRSMQVDIAIDLMGFTGGARPGIFAKRVAPVQVNYLGYPATTGTRFADYILADHFVIPTEQRPFYGEAIAYLPKCFQANDGQRFLPAGKPPLRAAAGLPAQGFIFCCFNSNYKITPAVFDIWMRLLLAVNGSVLWLSVDRTEAKDFLAEEARSRGVDPARLIFGPRVGYEEHLKRLQLADLFLDTYPFGAGATASDALWACLPVITRSGKSFASRMAGSLLTATGLAELAVPDAAAYEALALALARTPGRLSGYRRRLAACRGEAGGLFDTRHFTRGLEATYIAMLDRANSGLPPAHLLLSGPLSNHGGGVAHRLAH